MSARVLYPRYFSVCFSSLTLPAISAIASYYHSLFLEILALILLGCTVFVIVPEWRGSDEDKIFLVFLGSVSVSLILLGTLVSPNILGWDVNTELYTFSLIMKSGWNPTGFGVLLLSDVPLYNSVLSVTILPSMISQVSALNGIQIFKFVFPLLYSIVPLVLYKVYKCFLSSRASFIAAFFFMAYPAFYTELIGLGREEIAELFLVLLLVILLVPRVAEFRVVRFILILLTFGLVTAHYSLAFIYLGMLAVSFIIGNAWRKARSLDVAVSVLFAAVIVGLWYVVIVSPAALFSLSKFSSLVIEGLSGSFLNFSARPAEVLGSGSGLSHIANRYLQYSVMGILVLGFITVLKRKNTVEEEKMLPLMMVGMFLAGSIVALPFFASALNVTRTFHIALIFIAPCFVYGVSTLSKLPTRIRSLFHHRSILGNLRSGRSRWIWPASFLLLYFLFSSGLVFAVAMDTPTSPIVDLQRMMNSSNQNVVLYFNSYYRNPEDVAGARWLSNWRGNGFVCADFIAGDEVLLSYGEISISQQYSISTLPPPESCLIFSSVMNSRYGIWSGSTSNMIFPVGVLSNITGVNRIYSNGGSAVYNNPMINQINSS